LIESFNHKSSDVFVPDGASLDEAFNRTSHLAIGAHSDDLEIMAYHGIVNCYGFGEQVNKNWFTGITATDGRGSSRAGLYSQCSDEQMAEIRKEEQKQAAVVGRYSAVLQLGYSSDEIMDKEGSLRLKEDLLSILKQTKPRTVYTHNPADKHDTHIAVLYAAICAMRELPIDDRPEKILGCEVWRDLDWMPDEDKVTLDVSERENLANSLVGVFDSQITGGKRYDRAAVGRRYANATFFYAEGKDKAEQLTFAMDLTPVVHDQTIDFVEYVMEYINKFRDDVQDNLSQYF
jgi:LmbE family N-acetylglucosaminyl deacetylase|tara:strand:- start:443 stop:1312 length:870 start_codon:yes stop_codon:yes gene_type:complete